MKFTALPVHTFEDATLDLEQLQALLTAPAWIAPTFVNAWANVAGQPAGYLRDGLGFVHLRGAAQTGTTNTVAFTLPPGFRPGHFSEYAGVSSGSSGPSFTTVSTAGVVTLFYGTAGSTVTLDGFTFLAEN